MFKTFLVSLLVLLALAVAATAGFFYAARQAEAGTEALLETSRADFTDAVASAFDAVLLELEQRTEAIGGRFEEVDNLLTAQELRLRRYRNSDHLARARSLGVGRVDGQAEIDRLVAQGRLVKLEDTPYYYVQELDVSVAYVTPDALQLLERLGERFHAALRAQDLPRYRFCVSSVLRTADDQQALRRINPNAARGVSTHEFGTTLDIVYHKYDYLADPDDALPETPYPFLNARMEEVRVLAYDALGMRYWQELQGLLGRALVALQDEGAVLVTLERQQPVFHITVAKRLAP